MCFGTPVSIPAMKRLLALLPLIFALAFAAPGGTSAGAAGPDDFTMSANFSGLYPNADLIADVSVHNPQNFAIAVKAATVIVGDASPTCLAGNVIADSFSGDIVVPAQGNAIVPVRMQMLASAPNACQGAVFPLTFAAEGVIVGAVPGSESSTTGGFAFTGIGDGVRALVGIGLGAVVFGLLLVARRRFETVDG